MTANVVDFPVNRPLPHSVDAERACLGAILLNAASALPRVSQIVQPSDYFIEPNRIVYSTTLEMDCDGVEIDEVAVIETLRARGLLERVGGRQYVSGLTVPVPDIARVERYATFVRKCAQRRELIRIGYDAAERAFGNEDADDVAADLAEQLMAVRPADVLDTVMPVEALVDSITRLYDSDGVVRGFSTGWPSIDPLYTVARGAWTLITGIPGHGKSGFLDHLTIHLAKKHDWQTVMFSAENFPPESHLASLVEKFTGQPFNTGPTTRMTKADLSRGLAFVTKHYRFIDPAAERMTVDRLLAIASALAEIRRVDVLTIDPWNELHHERAEHISETEYISVCLTKIRRWARRHKAHVFLVAHPQKMQKDRDTGRYNPPTPYDVSGSAHWRNKADYCLCVYRDITNGDDDPNVQIHIQKARRREIGHLGMVTLVYDKVTSEYNDPAQPKQYRKFYDGNGE